MKHEDEFAAGSYENNIWSVFCFLLINFNCKHVFLLANAAALVMGKRKSMNLSFVGEGQMY